MEGMGKRTGQLLSWGTLVFKFPLLLLILIVLVVPFVLMPFMAMFAGVFGGDVPSEQAENEVPQDLAPIYQQAAEKYELDKYGVGWSLLASIHKQETNFGRTTKSGDPERQKMISSAQAKGPMQFTDATWKDYGVDGNGDGKKDVWNEKDAIFSTAHMLSKTLEKNGGDVSAAVYRYNHSDEYVSEVMARAQQYTEPTLVTKFNGSFANPVEGTVTSNFGMRFHPTKLEWKLHDGIDYGSQSGTPIRAAASGVVQTVGFDANGYGLYVVIRHGDGFETLYAHMSRALVTEGQKVDQSQKIGAVGNTGASTGAHLHFTVKKNGEPVNPVNYLSNGNAVDKKK